MLKDSRSYEVQIINAVRSVNRALGGTYGTSSAIHKSDFNQYEVQLIDAIKGIGRTLSGKGLSVAGFGVGEVTAEQFQELSQRVTKLENESFFRLVDGNVTLKESYRNLWVPGWLAAGGVGSGGGGGGTVEHLSDIGDVSISNLADGQGIVWDATEGVWKNAAVGGGGGGSGSVTSVGVSVPTGLSVSGSPITTSGTIAIAYASGYSIPTTAKQTSWDNKQNAISDLATIRAGAALGATAVQTETDPTVPAWAKAVFPSLYIGTTRVQTSSGPQNLTGILSVKAASENTSKFEWDDDNGAWHFLGNLYADGWVSAGGVGSGGSSGSVVSISNLLSSGTRIATITVNGTNYNILAPPSGTGTVTRIDLGNTSYTPVGGVVSLPAYPTTLPASDVYSWAKASSKPTYSLTEITGTDDLRAIEALAGTAGILKKTAANTWSLDTTAYLASGTTLDNIADGTTRKLSNYLPLSGGTMTGNITMSGASLLSSADSANSIGASDKRFNQAFVRNIYTTYLEFRNDGGDTYIGRLGFSSGAGAIYIPNGQTSSNYIFNATYGFFHEGNGNVPCGRSDHRWSYLYGVNADLTGGMVVGGDIVPATDLGSSLGYSTSRFANLNVRTIGSLLELNFKSQDNSAQTGYLTFKNGWMELRCGANVSSSYKQISFHPTYGLYPETAGINLGGSAVATRWANIYGENADLSGDLSLASSSHIDIGPLRIEYDDDAKALHITKKSNSDNIKYGIYADGFVAAGGVGQTS